MPDAVFLDGVTKRYGGDTVVQPLSLAIAPGEFFTLLGPSGSGKSTTLAMIAGFTLPDGGRVMLDGRDMTRAPPRARGLGMVFQNYAIFPHLDVQENVAFPLRTRGLRGRDVATRVADALASVRLTGLERRHVRALSGGQLQRVALARAIVARPAIVLMDEPLAALDKNLRLELQGEIRDIQQRLGITIVFVTHDQEEAMTLSTRIAILDHGRLVQLGPPRSVYERPDTAFVARFLGEANLIDGVAQGDTLRSLQGHVLRAANSVDDGPARLFVRPEKLSLRAPTVAATPGENRIGGTVRGVAFMGNVLRVTLDIAGLGPLLVDAVNGPHAPAVTAGAPIDAVWAAEDSRLLAT